jgi:deoxyribonuclease V
VAVVVPAGSGPGVSEVARATLTVDEAVRRQEELRRQVEPAVRLGAPPATIAGLDVSYAVDSALLAAAVVVLDARTLETRETAVVLGEATFPYVPGLLAFREAPVLLRALATLTAVPDVLMCDGYGLAHPRRCGLACHVGVETGVPTFGVAKTAFTSRFADPGPRRGALSPLLDAGEVVGRALRTRTGVKPVFVSVGHRITLDEATELTLAMCPRFRVPEPTRRADALSRAALRDARATPDGSPTRGPSRPSRRVLDSRLAAGESRGR